MKRLGAAVLILAVTIAIGAASLWHTRSAAKEMTYRIEMLQQARSAEGVELLKRQWERYERRLALHTRHSELESVAAKIAILDVKVKMEDELYWKMACEELLAAVEHLEQTERPLLKNIL
ncbi:MAG: DUF4363 family protein [Ruminococcaceae bacterium]|nr:DUF4363 family protein [Oscillospiraceae bacterium]